MSDDKKLEEYTAELKEADLFDKVGRVKYDSAFYRMFPDDRAKCKHLLHVKELRTELLYKRQRERAKQTYVSTKRKAGDEPRTKKRAKHDDDEEENKASTDDKEESKSSSDDTEEDSSSSSSPKIKLSATPPDDETTEACNFCGGEDCKLCERMRGNMISGLFYFRVCAIYNRMFDSNFRAPALTTVRPTFYEMVAYAEVLHAKVEVTQPEFDYVASRQDCRFCGCWEGVGAIMRDEGTVTRANLVPCCKLCSMIKVDVPERVFLLQCKRIVDHQRKCPKSCTKPLLDGTDMCADHYYNFKTEK